MIIWKGLKLASLFLITHRVKLIQLHDEDYNLILKSRKCKCYNRGTHLISFICCLTHLHLGIENIFQSRVILIHFLYFILFTCWKVGLG